MKKFIQTLTKSQKVGYTLSTLLSALLLLPAIPKMMGAEMFVEQFTANNIGEFLFIIGLGLAVSSILYAIPRTLMIGTLLLSSYFGGAILLHMTLDESFTLQAFILVLIWFFTYLRAPELILPKRTNIG